jgi:hypothetical protein
MFREGNIDFIGNRFLGSSSFTPAEGLGNSVSDLSLSDQETPTPG